MKLSENTEEIVIRHVPVKEWVIGGILTLLSVAVFLWLLFSLFLLADRFAPIFAGWLDAAPVLVIVGALILVLLEIKYIRAPLVTVTISDRTKSVDIVRQRFYGAEKHRFYFAQTGKFKSYKNAVVSKSTYFLGLILANKKMLKLKIPLGRDQQETTRLIKKLNKFVRTRTPSIAAPEDAEN
jgi:hypothetical protein